MTAQIRILSSSQDIALKAALEKLLVHKGRAIASDAGDAITVALWRRDVAEEEAEPFIGACLAAANKDRLAFVEIDKAEPPFGLRDLATIAWSHKQSVRSLARSIRRQIELLSRAPLTAKQARIRGAIISFLIAEGCILATLPPLLLGLIDLNGALLLTATSTALSLLLYWGWRGLTYWTSTPGHRARQALRRRQLGFFRSARLALLAIPALLLPGTILSAWNGPRFGATLGETAGSNLAGNGRGLTSSQEFSSTQRETIANRIAEVEYALTMHRWKQATASSVTLDGPVDSVSAEAMPPINNEELKSELATLYEQYVARLVAQSKILGVHSRIADADQIEDLHVAAAVFRHSVERAEGEASLWRWSTMIVAGGLLGAVCLWLLAKARSRARERRKFQASVQEAANTSSQALFISYARRDADRVDSIIAAIEGLGRSVWMDRRALTGEQEWTAQLASAITTAGGVAVMCSKAAFASDYVARELHLAMQEKKRIYAFDLEPAEEPLAVKFILAGAQRFDVSSGDVSEAVRRALQQ